MVNARFAEPLDTAALADAARGALCVVIVDDTERAGGFSSWVRDALGAVGVVQSVSIVAPRDSGRAALGDDGTRECALRIVERCRWLAAPIVPDIPFESLLPAVTEGLYDAGRGNWSSYLDTHADGMARERAQVKACQLSPDVGGGWRHTRM